jgi:hypothetical protein
MFSAENAGPIAFNQARHRIQRQQPEQVWGNRRSRVNDEAAVHPEIQSVSNNDIQVPVLDGGGRDQAADAEGQCRHHAHH